MMAAFPTLESSHSLELPTRILIFLFCVFISIRISKEIIKAYSGLLEEENKYCSVVIVFTFVFEFVIKQASKCIALIVQSS